MKTRVYMRNVLTFVSLFFSRTVQLNMDKIRNISFERQIDSKKKRTKNERHEWKEINVREDNKYEDQLL